jgi:hypothetical protein
MGSPIEDIAAERRRQVEVEGWLPEHDDEHADGSLGQVAACYADPDRPMGQASNYPNRGMHEIPQRWPASWGHRWWKPKDRRRDLIRAGALIVAEIERLDRAALLAAEPAKELSK